MLIIFRCIRNYVMFALWHELSVVTATDSEVTTYGGIEICILLLLLLLSVMFMRSAQRVELFGNILRRLIAQGLGEFVLKFWAKIQRGSCKLNTRGV